MHACHTHTGSGWGSKTHPKFQVCSYYSFKFINVLKTKFGIYAKLPLSQILPQLCLRVLESENDLEKKTQTLKS